MPPFNQGKHALFGYLSILTCILEWGVVRCKFKNGHHEDMCLKYIGLHAHNLLIVLDSTINKLGGPMWPSYGSMPVDFD